MFFFNFFIGDLDEGVFERMVFGCLDLIVSYLKKVYN